MNYKKIEGYDNYMISNTGLVLNTKKNKHLVSVSNGRYMFVLLYKNNIRSICYIHRLVASAFCEKQEGKNIVNHKDFNRYNNNMDNLEWVTSKQNRIHFTSSNKYIPRKISKNEIVKIKKRLYKKVLCTKTNKVYKSMGHYAKYKKISLSQVSQKLNNKLVNNLNAIFY